MINEAHFFTLFFLPYVACGADVTDSYRRRCAKMVRNDHFDRDDVREMAILTELIDVPSGQSTSRRATVVGGDNFGRSTNFENVAYSLSISICIDHRFCADYTFSSQCLFRRLGSVMDEGSLLQLFKRNMLSRLSH